MEMEYKLLAERFFRGVYGGDPSVVDDLAGADVVISYPIFARLFNTPAIRGREAVKAFAVGFGTRWRDGQVTIHEAIEDKDRVVLLWSFRARRADSDEQHSWGGISFFRFDETGKIIAEVGEESEPGLYARLANSLASD